MDTVRHTRDDRRPAGDQGDQSDQGHQSDQPDSSDRVGAWRSLWRGIVRWRTPLVVVPLLAGLVLAGAVGARMMTTRTPDPVGVVNTVTCWNGKEKASADDCATPAGKAGLLWVFPSLRPNRPQCSDDRKADPDLPRPVQFTCTIRVAGRTADVTYFQLADLRGGLRYHDRQFGRDNREKARGNDGETERYVWRRQVKDRYELVSAYVEHPFAVQVVAPERRVRERALRVVRFRASERIVVRSP